jgi:glycosyltransferase involved in cell wall biosynthesis
LNWYARGPNRELFPDLIRSCGYQSGVEIGVQRGEHAAQLLDAWPGKLSLVDPWEHQDTNVYPCMGNVPQEDHDRLYEEAKANTARFGDRAEIFREYSVEAAKRFGVGQLGFVYIDGNHTYDAVMQDLRVWYPTVAPGGIIAGHDFTNDGNPDLPKGGVFGVEPAVLDFLEEHPYTLHVAREEEFPTWYFFKTAPAATSVIAEHEHITLAPADRKPRLLWIGDAIAHTGFARVTHSVCQYLKDTWDLLVIGLNYDGSPHAYDYPIWPARNGGDIWGLGMYNRLVTALRPDAVCVLNDPWIVARFCERKAPDTPMAAYMPVDAKNIPEGVIEGMGNLDLAIFYTEFGKHQAELGGFTGRSAIIPHGIDLSIYRPLDKREARERLNLSETLADNAFIVGNVNRNQPRKRLDLTVQYFAEWVHRNRLPENVYLYIHCAQRDQAGWNLAQLGRYFGVERRLMLPDPGAVTPAEGFPEAFMPWIYSAFDLQITTTMGEGWGLPQAEGMACGIPQIMPMYSALAEWAAGAAYFVPCTGEEAHIVINTIGGIPDKEDFIRALDRMYREPELRREYSEKALARAREPRFRWWDIADLFQCHLGQMLIDARAKSKEKETEQHVEVPETLSAAAR